MGREYYEGALSLNKAKNSPFWMVSFRGRDDAMKRRSTKVPYAGGDYKGGRLTVTSAKKLAFQIGTQIANEEAEMYGAENNITVRQWLDDYVSSRMRSVAEDTYRNARTAYRHFCEVLGKKAEMPIRLVTKADVKAFVSARREVVRAETVKKDFSAIRMAFRDAVDANVIEEDPTRGVNIPADRASEKVHKEAFTVDEVRYILEHFPPMWASAVRCCVETYGQRLGDILSLDWKQFDWERRVVRFVTGKTGRVLYQPMRDSFYEWVRAKWEHCGNPDHGLLHAPLLAMGNRASYEFGLLLRAHGIGTVSIAEQGNRRKVCSKSFHSLRATVATLLQAGGTAQGIAMELVGHESADVHRVYIRPSNAQLLDAAKKMPIF